MKAAVYARVSTGTQTTDELFASLEALEKTKVIGVKE